MPPRASLSLWLIAILLAALAFPFLVKGYFIFQVTMILSYAVALLGLNLLTSYNGQISLGHGAFYAIGAYTTAILMDHFGVPYWMTIPAAGIVCTVSGYLFGLNKGNIANSEFIERTKKRPPFSNPR